MKIGITQRVELNSFTGELRDCLDQKWYDLSNKLNFNLIQIPNIKEDINLWIKDLGIKGFILSGGNDLRFVDNPTNANKDRDLTEIIILNLARQQKLPVIGICRGLQMINHYFGGFLIPVKGHIGDSHPLKIKISNKKVSNKYVNSFHKWGINEESLGKNLIPFAWDQDGNIEGVIHPELNWIGIMWHPERMTNLEELDKEIFLDLFLK